MKKVIIFSSLMVSSMLTAALDSDATVEIATIKALPVTGGEQEWKAVIDQFAVRFPQQLMHFNNVSAIVDGLERIIKTAFPQGEAGDTARALAYTKAKIALGSLREDVEKQLAEFNTRVMDRSYSLKNQGILRVKALYEQLLARIAALQNKIK